MLMRSVSVSAVGWQTLLVPSWSVDRVPLLLATVVDLGRGKAGMESRGGGAHAESVAGGPSLSLLGWVDAEGCTTGKNGVQTEARGNATWSPPPPL